MLLLTLNGYQVRQLGSHVKKPHTNINALRLIIPTEINSSLGPH